MTKHCPQCDRELPETAFARDKSRYDGLCGWCKECTNRKQRERYANDESARARKLARQKERLADPVEYAKNQERNREWYARKAVDAEWRKKHNSSGDWANRTPEQKERKIEANRIQYAANRDYMNKRHREYVKERYHSDDKFRKNMRDWFTRRQNTKRANGGDYTKQEWEMLCLLVGYRCVKCGQIAKLTVDHIIPISEDGRNDVDNIQPLCRSCNASKGTDDTDYRPLTLIATMGLELSEII